MIVSHSELRGTPGNPVQIEALNVTAKVGRRDNDDPDSDYVVVFEDSKSHVKIFVPMNPSVYRDWVEALHSNLSGVILPDKKRLEVVSR